MRPVVLLIALACLGAFLATACGNDDPSASIAVDPPGEDVTADDPEAGDLAGTDGVALPEDAEPGADQPPCQPNCGGRECGDNGCGGSCGSCGGSLNCLDGVCGLACDSPSCGLAKACVFPNGVSALCGGTLTFETTLTGKPLQPNVSVQTLFGNAGVLFYTDSEDVAVATNYWELNSPSGHNSCATIDKFGNPWTHPVAIRFVVPVDDGYMQAATHFVSFYVGNTWPGGLIVDFYGPNAQPGMPGSQPLHSAVTNANGTAFVEHASGEPIGYVVVRAGDDPDFTLDDLTFGPLYVP